MKIKKGFVLSNIAGKTVAVSTDSSNGFAGMITMNSTAEFIWRMLENGAEKDEICSSIVSTYSVSEEDAERDASAFIDKLYKAGVLDVTPEENKRSK